MKTQTEKPLYERAKRIEQLAADVLNCEKIASVRHRLKLIKSEVAAMEKELNQLEGSW